MFLWSVKVTWLNSVQIWSLKSFEVLSCNHLKYNSFLFLAAQTTLHHKYPHLLYSDSKAQTVELANDGYKLYENHLIFSIALGSQPPVKLRLYESIQEVSRHQPHGKLAQDSFMNHVIKALKKLWVWLMVLCG